MPRCASRSSREGAASNAIRGLASPPVTASSCRSRLSASSRVQPRSRLPVSSRPSRLSTSSCATAPCSFRFAGLAFCCQHWRLLHPSTWVSIRSTSKSVARKGFRTLGWRDSSDNDTKHGALDLAPFFNSSLNKEVSQLSSPNQSLRSTSSPFVERQQKQTSQRTIGASQERGPGSKPENNYFDIFRTANVGLMKSRKPFRELNKEKKRESECFKNATEPQYLRSGMVLLKSFLNIADQVKVLNKCRELGIGSGGFYRPGYRNGSKLNLQMMCLGKDWDPASKLYKDSRLFDDAVPPEIPGELRKLVDGALHAAHNFLRQSSISVEEIPSMSPDVCIVNFYSTSGKLGLHQDKDESKESLDKGLPVVSFSVGDSADFLYSDVRNPSKAEKVMLESGDVLIFGGKSRLIFHGVPSIMSNTAPAFLTNVTALRPGRLNLTFRQL